MFEHLKELIATISEPASAVLIAAINWTGKIVLEAIKSKTKNKNLMALMLVGCVCLCAFVAVCALL